MMAGGARGIVGLTKINCNSRKGSDSLPVTVGFAEMLRC